MIPTALEPFALFFWLALVGSAIVGVYDGITYLFNRARRSLATRHSSPFTPAKRRLLALMVFGSAVTRGNVLVVSSGRLMLRRLTAPVRLLLLLFGRSVFFIDDYTSPEFMQIVTRTSFARCILVRDVLGRYSHRGNEAIAQSGLKGREGALLYVDTPVKRVHRPVTAARVTTSN